MSGREKPLILQNGMPIPQEYDKDLGDWTEYSNEHIKAIKAELALVKAELQAIKANQLSGDQKVTLSGTKVLKPIETIFSREILTATEGNYVYPPEDAIGGIFWLNIYGITGTFTDNQGVSLEMLPLRSVNNRPSISVKTDITRTSNIAHTIVISPSGLFIGDGVEVVGRFKYAGLPLGPRLRYLVDISGTFDDGQGVDCSLAVSWITR